MVALRISLFALVLSGFSTLFAPSVQAMTLAQAMAFPDVAASLDDVPVAPFKLVPTDVSVPANVGVDAAGSGAYVVGTQTLRDAEGRLLDQLPALTPTVTFDGYVYVPAGDQLYGMLSVPAGGHTDTMRLGETLFSSVGIALAGRREVAGRLLKGASYYEDVLCLWRCAALVV